MDTDVGDTVLYAERDSRFIRCQCPGHWETVAEERLEQTQTYRASEFWCMFLMLYEVTGVKTDHHLNIPGIEFNFSKLLCGNNANPTCLDFCRMFWINTVME